MPMASLDKHKLNQSGFASITIALILVILLSLLTVGFAQLARREQRTALDKQLASQAYYAAESGVNDVKALIDSGTTDFGATSATQCTNLPPPNDPVINRTSGVKYTCVLIDLKPKNLVFNHVEKDDERVVIFSNEKNGLAAKADSFVVSWSSADGKNTPRSNQDNSKDWGNSPAVLQVSLTPIDTVSRADLITNTMTAYLYPTASVVDNSVNYATNTVVKKSGGCSGTGQCKTTFNVYGIANTYLLRFLNYYDASTVSIGDAKSGGTPMTFVGAQAQVDVTGKARNVLKRIQVRIPLKPKNSSDFPGNGLEAQHICKRFSTDPIEGTKFNYAVDGSGSCTLSP